MRRRTESASMTILTESLKAGEHHSRFTAAALLGITPTNARRYLKLLRPKLYVASWTNRGRGPWDPTYAWGNEPDAPVPQREQARRARLVREMPQSSFGRRVALLVRGLA